MNERETKVTDAIVEADQDWNDKLTLMASESLGLTPDEYAIFTALETDEEMDAFMAKHSKK